MIVSISLSLALSFKCLCNLLYLWHYIFYFLLLCLLLLFWIQCHKIDMSSHGFAFSALTLLVRLYVACKNPSRNDLLCVGCDVKPYSLVQAKWVCRLYIVSKWTVWWCRSHRCCCADSAADHSDSDVRGVPHAQEGRRQLLTWRTTTLVRLHACQGPGVLRLIDRFVLDWVHTGDRCLFGIAISAGY